MKRDLSLIRLMLLRIEELAGIKPELNLADFADLPATRECLLFHTRLLIRHDLSAPALSSVNKKRGLSD